MEPKTKKIFRPQYIAVLLLVVVVGAVMYYLNENEASEVATFAAVGGPVGPPANCDFYAAPNNVGIGGNTGGSGTAANPWGLRTALAQPGNVIGNKTLCLKSGTYTGKFIIYTSDVTIRSAPGEWAVIDGNGVDATGDDTADIFQIFGSSTIVRDFEIISSRPFRTFDIDRDFGGDWNAFGREWTRRGTGVAVKEGAHNSKIINMVIRDTLTGIYAGMSAQNIEVVGNIVYHNGIKMINDRGHGHGIYMQSDTGTKWAHDNFFFNQFGLNMDGFADDAQIRHINYSDNILSGGAMLYTDGYSGRADIFVGSGSQPAQDITIDNNVIYNRAGFDGGGISLGYGAANDDVRVRNNRIMGGISGIGITNWASVVATGNKIYVTHNPDKQSEVMNVRRATGAGWTVNNNTYMNVSTHAGFPGFMFTTEMDGAPWINFTQWKAASGFDSNTSYSTSPPTGIETIIKPNPYEQGRANVAIYNWGRAATVPLTLTSANTGLAAGQNFAIRNVQNYHASPVFTGTMSGSSMTINMPMNHSGVETPIGHDFTPPPLCPEFCMFVVTPIYGGTPPPTDTTPAVLSAGSPTGSLPAGTTTANLSLTTNEAATCKYGTTANVAYGSIANTLTTTGGTSHLRALTGLTNGTTYNYYVRCQDAAGNANGSDYPITFSVAAPAGDTTNPVVSMTAPAGGSTVSGSNVTVSANATDAGGVVGVQFKLDGANLGAEDTVAPYSTVWNTTQTSNASHSLSATARDAAGNVGNATPINVTVNNVVPPSTAATPTITPNGGSFSTTQSVTLATATSGSTIRYTTNGSNPSSTVGTIYSGAFNVAVTSTVKAIAYKAGSTDSAIASATFTITPVVTGPAPRITSFGLAAKTQTSATIRWRTNIQSTGIISYGTDKNNLNQTVAQTTPGSCSATSCLHTAVIPSLTANTLYYYKITATNNNASTTSIRSSFRTRR